MKRTKKFVSLLLALVMVFAMTVTAYADDPETENPPATETTQTGSITINGRRTTDGKEEITVAGKTFNAYKILDVISSYTESVEDDEGNTTTQDTVVYAVPEALKAFYAAYYGIDETVGDFDYQVVEAVKNDEDLFAFAAAALNAAKGNSVADEDGNVTLPGASTAIASVSAQAGEGAKSVTIRNLPLGYYVVEDVGAATPISALILDTTNPNVEVEIKADKPSLDKKIVETEATEGGGTQESEVSYNNAAVGDTVSFKLTSKVPDMTGYTKYYFVVKDTLSKGLTFNEGVEIKVGEKTLDEDDYTITVTAYTKDNIDEDEEEKIGTTDIEIVFKDFIQYKDLNENDAHLATTGSDIIITYTATVNNNAVIGVEGNENTATLTYSNNPNISDSGDEKNPDKPTPDSPVGETPESETRTYVTGLELIKVDSKGNRLTGAEFELTGTKLNTVLVRTETFTEAENGEYWKLKDGSYTTEPPVIAEDETDTSKYYESTTQKYTKVIATTPITKTENVTYTGTVGEDGVLIFDGLAAGDYKIEEIKAPAGYNLLKDSIYVKIEFSAPAENNTSTDCTWTYYNSISVTDENPKGISGNQITVENHAGNELPSTGGMGTTVFYVLGFILVAGAAVLLITKRRMSAEK